MLHLFLGVKEL